MSQETLRMVYFAHIPSIMIYGTIFWGNQPYSDKIFKSKKGWLESSQIQDWFMYGTVQKIRNTALIFSIYLFTINICVKKQTFILYK